jgi:hypothetical protein
MTPDAWVDLAYSALVAGAIALFFREYDSDAEAEQWMNESVAGCDDRGEEPLISHERRGAGGNEVTRPERRRAA